MRRGGRRELQETVARLARRVEELEAALQQREPVLPKGAPGWHDDEAVGASVEAPVSHQWLAILEPPLRRRRRLPRLPLEVLFLAACAVAAGVADLEPRWIAAVMGGAWLLVSLTEWSATLADRRLAERDAMPPPALVPVTSERPDRAWYIPPVEQTFAQGPVTGSSPTGSGLVDSATAIGRRRPSTEDVETTIERRVADTQA